MKSLLKNEHHIITYIILNVFNGICLYKSELDLLVFCLKLCMRIDTQMFISFVFQFYDDKI